MTYHRECICIHTRKHEYQRRGLELFRHRLHRNPRHRGKIAVACGIYEIPPGNRFSTVLVVYDDIPDTAVSIRVFLIFRSGYIGVEIYVDSGFLEHTLRHKLVFLGGECDVAERFLLPCSTDSGESFHKLPRQTVDYTSAVVIEHTYRCDKSCGRHTAEKTVTLDNTSLGAFACRSQGGDYSTRSAATYNNVITGNNRYLSFLFYSYHNSIPLAVNAF